MWEEREEPEGRWGVVCWLFRVRQDRATDAVTCRNSTIASTRSTTLGGGGGSGGGFGEGGLQRCDTAPNADVFVAHVPGERMPLPAH